MIGFDPKEFTQFHQALAKQICELQATAKSWVQDKSVALDERWALFTECGLGADEYKCDLRCTNGFTFYDDLGVERGGSRDAATILEILEEHVEFYGVPDRWNCTLDDIREEILEDYASSYTHDW